MSFLAKETIDQLKRQWTDRLITVKADARPELKRFEGKVGRVVTVSYSGRAVVDFGDGTYGVRLGANFYRVDNDLPVATAGSARTARAATGAGSGAETNRGAAWRPRLHGDGSGKLTAAASTGTSTTLTFASTSDYLGVKRLKAGGKRRK